MRTIVSYRRFSSIRNKEFIGKSFQEISSIKKIEIESSETKRDLVNGTMKKKRK